MAVNMDNATPASSDAPIDRAFSIFGNKIGPADYQRACASKARFAKKFGDDTKTPCHLTAGELPVVGDLFGARRLEPCGEHARVFDIYADASPAKPVVIGNIRMGFGHYRIAMAMASAAHALGYAPYWFDLCAFPNTTCTKIINKQNEAYSLGSRVSQKSKLFDMLVWDPMNSEGFRKLSYNASDQKVAELMTAPYQDLPRDVPFIGTHAWTAQAAIHAGLTNVVNAIPDNWPMALHLAEGSTHVVQTLNARLGYRVLNGMGKHNQLLKPMPEDALVEVGHFVDHELVANIEDDCARRVRRSRGAGSLRFLLSVGGTGAQQALLAGIIEHMMPAIRDNKVSLLINVGDHEDVWEALLEAVPGLNGARKHFGDFDEVDEFARNALDGEVYGIHTFFDSDLYSAVYSTNVLMRCCDVLISKPGELSFYPVPKIMMRHVGGHEVWGAIRAAEVGDGTIEMETLPEICAMIDEIVKDPVLVEGMCFNIRANKVRGVYNGAYEAVKIACGEH